MKSTLDAVSLIDALVEYIKVNNAKDLAATDTFCVSVRAACKSIRGLHLLTNHEIKEVFLSYFTDWIIEQEFESPHKNQWVFTRKAC